MENKHRTDTLLDLDIPADDYDKFWSGEQDLFNEFEDKISPDMDYDELDGLLQGLYSDWMELLVSTIDLTFLNDDEFTSVTDNTWELDAYDVLERAKYLIEFGE